MRRNGSSSGIEAEAQNESLTGDAERDRALIIDDELDSAAAPFLYLLSSLVIAAAGYLLFVFLHG